MKPVLVVALMLAFVGVAQAQPNQKVLIYTDTTVAGQITEAQSAAALLRGFTGYTILRSDIQNYNARRLQVSFRGKTSRTLAAATSFTTDSVKFQGRYQKKASPNVLDTGWVDIRVTLPLLVSGINVAKGVAEQRDTTVTWIFAGTIGDSRGYVSPEFTLPDYYDEYRMVNATKDSGRVVLKQKFIPRW